MNIVRCLLVGLGFAVSGASHASDALDKKLFLMGRALKNGDCMQALDVSAKLLAEFAERPGPHLLRGRTEVLCNGDNARAWYHFERYLEKGGDRSKVQAELDQALSLVARVDLFVNPLGHGIPLDFDDGIRLGLPTGTAVIMDDGRHYRLAMVPGRRTIQANHLDPRYKAQASVEGEAGSHQELVLEPKSPMTKLIVTLESSQDTESVTVKAVHPSDEREVLMERDSPGVFSVVIPSGTFELLVESANPLISGAQLEIVGHPAETIERVVTLKTLEPATLSVGPLEAAIDMKVRLPHGPIVAVKRGTTISTGGGSAEWAARLENDDPVRHKFEVPAGTSELPLPSAVELVVDGKVVVRQLLSPSMDRSDSVMLKIPGAKSKDDKFAVALKSGQPGQFQRVVMDFEKVPAIVSYRDWKKLQSRQLVVGGGAVGSIVAASLSMGLSAGLKGQASDKMAEASALSGAGAQSQYDDLTAEAGQLVNRSNIAMATAVGTGLISATLAYYFFRNRSVEAQKRVEYQAHRRVAFVP